MENISDKLVKELEKNPEAKLIDVECLQEWCSSRNLPPLKDFELLEFHHSCFYNIEETKKCIVSHFKIRQSKPELFTKRYLTIQPLKDYISRVLQCFPLGATKDGCQIILARLMSNDYSIHNYTLDIQLVSLTIEVLLHKFGTFPGLILVIDYDKITISHILWAKWSHIRVYLRYLHEGLPIRLNSIEVIMTSAIASYGLTAIKPFTSRDILNKIVFHSPTNMSTFYEKIPIENLPKEYGGSLPSCDELQNKYIKEVADLKNYFDEKDDLESNKNST